MKKSAKVFVPGILGLLVLVAASSVNAAQIGQSRCTCSCWYGVSQGYNLGSVTFAPPKPNDTSCAGFTSFDRYFVCKDSAGKDQAGAGYAINSCKFTPGIKVSPNAPPLRRAP